MKGYGAPHYGRPGERGGSLPREFVWRKGGEGSGWFGPPKGDHVPKEDIKLPPISNLEDMWPNIANMTPERAAAMFREELAQVPPEHLAAVDEVRIYRIGEGMVAGKAHITKGTDDFGKIDLDGQLASLWTLRHEVGHIVEAKILQWEDWRKLSDIYREEVVQAANRAGARTSYQIENWGIKNYISGYATFDTDEMFAVAYERWFSPDSEGRAKCRERIGTVSPKLAALLKGVTP